MPVTPSRKPPPPPLRVVFFGPPRSGKSELLQRVVAVASRQAEDPPIDLAVVAPTAEQLELRRQLVPHQVRVDLPDGAYPAESMILLDCDGQAAGELLSDPSELVQAQARSELVQAIHSADALVLIIDATWDEATLQASFADFKKFLVAFNAGRAFRREVGGLPVILAITKCDSLFREHFDDLASWLGRITRQEADVQREFHEYFEDPSPVDGETNVTNFGSIRQLTFATAKRVPDGEMYEAYRDETGGLGANDLTVNLLSAASDYRDRCLRSTSRLKWTAVGALGLLLALVLGLLTLSYLGEPSPAEQLAQRVRAYQAQDHARVQHLSDRLFPWHKKELDAMRESPAFGQLPPELRQFVLDRHSEFEAYGEYRSRFHPPQFSPAEVRTRTEWDQLRLELETRLQPPPEYAKAWQESEATQLRLKWQRDLDLYKAAEEQVHDWYRTLIRRSTQLLLVDIPSVAWRDEIRQLLQDAQKLPFRTEDSIAGSPSVPVRRGNPLTYAAAFNYERVEAARRDWEFAAHKIADLRDLCTALGMIPSESNAIPVLDLPEPNAESHASLALAGDRLALLQERYPRAVSGAADWSPSAFPDPIRQELAKRLRLTADTGMRHVRRLILKELNLAPGRPDTPTDWQRLPGGLLKKPEMAQWGKLLRLFFRWVDLPQLDVDPVADLTEFLQKPRIEAEIDSLELVIPNALRVERLAPDGPLVLAYLTSEGVPTSQEFKLDGPGLAVDQGVKYRFAPKSRPAKFRLRPGDDFSVGLALKSETGGFKLSWPTARTASYPIERLSREPWIVRTGPAGVPQRATGVQLRIVPEQPALRVPELLPEIPGLSK